MFYVCLADIDISFITMPKPIQKYHHNVKILHPDQAQDVEPDLDLISLQSE